MLTLTRSFPARFLPLLLVALTATGCNFEQATFTTTSSASVSHAPASSIKVTARNGAITLHKGADPAQAVITATFRMVSEERLGEVSIVADHNSAGGLEISAKPPADGWRGNEGCSFDITVPDASGIELSSSNGRLSLAGLAGKARLKTSNGAIEISGHNGDVDAHSSNGRIEVTGITGAFAAETSNGAVKARLADGSAGPVDINTSNGGVTLEITPAFRGEISIGTSNGSIHVPEAFPAGLNVQTSVSGHHGRIAIGDGGPKSTIQTSNGSVTVRFAN